MQTAEQARQQQDMQDRVCLVTGANTGIGRSTAHALAARGAEIVLACRSLEKALPVAEDIKRETGNRKVHVHALDLARFDAVRESADRLVATGRPLHVLINNAGLAGQQGLTPEGFEIAFGTNHLGSFLFTLLLLDRLRESTPARIVMVASSNHRTARRIDYEAVQRPTKSITGLPEYGVSKLANVLFAAELARRLEGTGVTTYALNPGRIASDIWKRIPWPVRPMIKRFMKSNEEGAQTSVMCASSEQLGHETGLYYNQCVKELASKPARDPALARELWQRSCEFVGFDEDPLPLPRT